VSAQPQRDVDPNLRLLNGELWLARRLSRFGVLVGTFEGITDSAERKERLRHEIKSRGLELVIVDIPAVPGKKRATINYRQAFERLYGDAL
jgi:hypothetical protein